MRWNHKDEVHEFIRPVRGIVALIDKEILPVKFFGIEADRTLKAHRQLAPNPISLDHADNYKEVLKKNACIASFEERENFIKSEIEKLVKSINGVALLDDELLSILASLTEFPHPLLATFDSSFLSLPKEVLISEMKVHQKYVPIVDKNGVLLPNYIITSNLSSF
jgi:glycyl-tRNA synthetase beta chain